MKKILGLIAVLLVSLIIGLQSCTNCSNGQFTQTDDITAYITLDNQYMATETGNDFRWYETEILLDEFLDEECDGSIAELVNIFQVAEMKDSTSFDTKVFKFQHFADGRNAKGYTLGFWIEDYPMKLEEIKVPYKKAFEIVQQVNLPKPHSQHVVLRNPIGPKGCNPQWIFGNIHEQIWIDAVTGEARSSNPAFPDGFKMPLGEWP